MNVVLALIIYFLIFVGGLILLTIFRQRILKFSFVASIVTDPTLFYVYATYYLLLTIYLLSLIIPISGSVTQTTYYRSFRYVLTFVVAVSSILYGSLAIIRLINTRF